MGNNCLWCHKDAQKIPHIFLFKRIEIVKYSSHKNIKSSLFRIDPIHTLKDVGQIIGYYTQGIKWLCAANIFIFHTNFWLIEKNA